MTIDDDIAAALERLRKSRDVSFKDIVNQALRQGLREMAAPTKPRKRYRTPAVDLGTPLLPNIDNVAEVLAFAEGETFK
ncbi:MAG: CopG family transcriptional regulator [Rhizomicrobium sp.]